MWWLALAALALVVSCVLVLLPIRLQLSVQGRGEPGGAWAVAGGAQIGPALASGVAARGVTPRYEVRVFGRTLLPRAKKEDDEAERDEAEEETDALERAREGLERAKDGYRRFERWLDPGDLLVFLVQERRRIQVESLDLDLDYSFRDIVTTGKLLGAIYALAGAMPPVVSIRQRASWEAEDRFELVGAGKIRIFPGLIVVDTLWFVIRNLRLFRRRAS